MGEMPECKETKTMIEFARILKSPGEPDEVFTNDEAISTYLEARWTVYAITGSSLTIQRVLTDDTVVAEIVTVRLNPEDFR